MTNKNDEQKRESVLKFLAALLLIILVGTFGIILPSFLITVGLYQAGLSVPFISIALGLTGIGLANYFLNKVFKGGK